MLLAIAVEKDRVNAAFSIYIFINTVEDYK